MFEKLKTHFMVLLCFVLFICIFIANQFLPTFAADTSLSLPQFYDSCNRIQLFSQVDGNAVLVGFKNNACRADILSKNGQTASFLQTAFSSEKAVFGNNHLFFFRQCGQHYGFVYANIKKDNSFSATHIIPIKYGGLLHCECDSLGRLYCLSSDNNNSILVLNSNGQPISTIKAENQKILSFSVTPSNYLFIHTKNSVYSVNLSSSFTAYRSSGSFIPKFPLCFLEKSTAVDSSGTLVVEKNGKLIKSSKFPISPANLAVSSSNGYICSQDGNSLSFYSHEILLTGTQETDGNILALHGGNTPFFIIKKPNKKIYLQFISYPIADSGTSASSEVNSSEIKDSVSSAETPSFPQPSPASDSNSEIRVKSGTSLAYMCKEFFPGKNCRFFLPNNHELTYGKVRTGMRIIVKSKDDSQSFILCVPGDITGSGNVNSRDVSATYAVLLNRKKLSGIYVRACDYDNDGKITTADLLWIKKVATTYGST